MSVVHHAVTSLYDYRFEIVKEIRVPGGMIPYSWEDTGLKTNGHDRAVVYRDTTTNQTILGFLWGVRHFPTYYLVKEFKNRRHFD